MCRETESRSGRDYDFVADADEGDEGEGDNNDEHDDDQSPDDEQDEGEENSDGEQVPDRRGRQKRVAPQVAVVVAKKPKLIGDGFVCRLFDGSALLYFSLSNEKEGVRGRALHAKK